MKSDRPKDYRLTVRVRNNHILEAIERTHASVAAFARDHRLPYQYINDLVCMRRSPRGQRGWHNNVIDLADALGVEPDALFTDRQLTGMPKSTVVRRVDEADIISLSNARGLLSDDDLDNTIYNREIAKMVDLLPPRQRYIMERKFGLNDREEASSEAEIATELKVTTTRVNQISTNTLRKLKTMVNRSEQMASHKP